MEHLHPELVRRDRHPIGDDKTEVRLFGVLRDEILRLPYFLEYYRKLGVSRFFLINNLSKDGSEDYLLQQPDCHVFYTEGSYGRSKAGVAWLNSVLDIYGTGHWIVLADIDELLAYPGCETTKLPRFCNWLDSSGHEAIYALMLDMYSPRRIRDVSYVQGEDFLKACPFHDSTYFRVRRFGFPNPTSAFPPFEHIGGPRLRLCFQEQHTPAVWPRLKPKLERRALTAAHKLGLLKDREPPPPAPQAFKMPLTRWRQGNAYINSHRLNPVKLAPVTGAMLHFKYFQDFGRKIEDAIRNGEHYNGSVEYRRYAELISAQPNLSLVSPESVEYSSSQGLVDQGLMDTTSNWQAKISSLPAERETATHG